MKKSAELKVLRSSKVDAQQALLNTVQGEKRSMTEQENAQFDSLETEINDLTAQIERQEAIEAAMARNASFVGGGAPSGANGEKREYEQLIAEARLVDLIAIGKNERVEGASAELAQETKRRNAGVEGVGVPVEMFAKRTASTVFANNTSVASPQGTFVEALRPMTTVIRAGAQMLTDLNGTVILPRGKKGVAVWEGETDDNEVSGAGLDGVKLSPKRLTFKTPFSKMLAKTIGSLQAEEVFRNDALLAIAEGVDKAALAGAAASTVPTGIINMADVNAVAIGTNGGALTYAAVLQMIQKQLEADSFREGLSWVTSARTFTGAHSISKDTGSGKFLVNDENQTMQGLPIYPSNHIPTDLAKGSGTNLSALILGWFPGLTIGQFGVLDLLVDPWTLADNGQDKITLNGYFDVKAGHDAYFTVVKDLTT